MSGAVKCQDCCSAKETVQEDLTSLQKLEQVAFRYEAHSHSRWLNFSWRREFLVPGRFVTTLLSSWCACSNESLPKVIGVRIICSFDTIVIG